EARSPDQRASARCNRMFPYVGLVFPGEAVVRSEMVEPVLEEKDEGVLGLAEPSGGLDKRIEHRLELESRAADDLEDLRGRGLLLERFAQLLGADLDLLLEVCIGFLQPTGHVVELVGQRLELVAGLDRDALRKVAAADPRSARAQRLDRPDH